MIALSKLKVYDKGLGRVKGRNLVTAPDDILAVEISHDGRCCAASTFDRIWYLRDNRIIWKLRIDNFCSLSLSGCGRYLVIGTLSRLIFMDAHHFKPDMAYLPKSNDLPEECVEKNHWIKQVSDIDMTALSSDGRTIIIAGERTLRLYNNLGESLWNFEIGDKIWGVSFSTDGTAIAASSGKEVYYFNQDGKLLWQFRTGSLVRFPHVSGDGRRILASSNKKIYLFSQRGQLLSEVNTGTSQTVHSSEDLSTIAGGSSTNAYCIGHDGTLLWEREEKDFITMVRVTGNGEGVIIGTGSDILTHPALHVYHKDGALLWSYLPKNPVKCVATDVHGHVIIAGIGRRVRRFENTLIMHKTFMSVSDRCKTILEFLRERGIDVARHTEEYNRCDADLSKGESESALNGLLELERELHRVKDRFHMARETIPNWLESLGVNVEVTDTLLNGIFPLYNKYVDLNDNASLTTKHNQLDSYITNLKKAYSSVDQSMLEKKKDCRRQSVLIQKLSSLSTSIDGLNGLQHALNELKSEKINFIFELEDTTRNVILDHISGKNYEKEINDAIKHAMTFERHIGDLLLRIQEFEATIKSWRDYESMTPLDNVFVDLGTDVTEEGGQISLTIEITNNYETPITMVSIRTFTNDPIRNFVKPEHGVMEPVRDREYGKDRERIQDKKQVREIPSKGSTRFKATFTGDSTANIIVNGLLVFEVDRVEYRVKLPPQNISLLPTAISPYKVDEDDYSRIMESNETYREGLLLRNTDISNIWKHIKVKLKEEKFHWVRNKEAETESGKTYLLWCSARLGRSETLFVTAMAQDSEENEILVSITSFSNDLDKGRTFAQDIMNYFRMKYKHKDACL